MPNLITVLQELSLEALDTIIETLHDENNLPDLRETSRELCHIVDCNIRSIKLTANDQRLQLWKKGYRLPLARWPRCSKVIVVIHYPDEGHWYASTLLSMPFAGQPTAARKHITHLVLDELFGDEYEGAFDEGAAVSALVGLLPELRHVDMASLAPHMSRHAVQQQLMYDALANLQHLEELLVPCTSGLAHVGCLAGSLKRLEIEMKRAKGGLSRAAVKGVMQLHCLTQLHISGRFQLTDAAGGADGGMSRLLAHVSALAGSLEHLEVEVECVEKQGRLVLTDGAVAGIAQLQRLRYLHLGWCRLQGDRATEPACCLPKLMQLLPASVRTLKLGIHFVPGWHTYFRIDIDSAGRFTDVHVTEGGVLMRPVPCTRLTHILMSGRGAQGRLGRLHVSWLTVRPDAEALEGQEQLQPMRELVGLFAGTDLGGITVHDTTTAHQQRALVASEILGVPNELQLRALHSVMVFNLRSPASSAAEMVPPPPPQELEQRLPSPADIAVAVLRRLAAAARNTPDLVLLHGSSLAVLAESPDALLAFIRRLENQARASLGTSAPNGGCVLAYQWLPATPALLLDCSTRADVARAMAEAAADVAFRHEASVLQAAPIASGEPFRCRTINRALQTFVMGLKEELKAMWDNVGARHQADELVWLRHLLHLAAVFATNMLPLVSLQPV